MRTYEVDSEGNYYVTFKDETVRVNSEFAAWGHNIKLDDGTYELNPLGAKQYWRKDLLYCEPTGVITSWDYTPHFGGNPYHSPETKIEKERNIGRKTTHCFTIHPDNVERCIDGPVRLDH
jgi:hypothetical protein